MDEAIRKAIEWKDDFDSKWKARLNCLIGSIYLTTYNLQKAKKLLTKALEIDDQTLINFSRR
ncbi:MAG: hypothetical protein ACW99A_03480 [Candidatus Kariarchaeaceae archaeon]